MFLKDYLRLLNEFLLNSSIGEFAARHEMLKAFSPYCEELADTVLKNRLLLLDNITAFFSQFLPSVNQKIDDIKKPLLKDLKQYVQIASWKDVNVFALKESAKRADH